MSGIFIEGVWHENTDMKCRRCGSPVWDSHLPEYEYQCLECDEDLYSFEVTEQDPHYHPRVAIAKHIEDITLNPLECLIDGKGNLVVFGSQILAESFLMQHGYSTEDLEHVFFIEFGEVSVSCLNCDHIFKPTGASHDELGWHITCEKCNSSFDIELP